MKQIKKQLEFLGKAVLINLVLYVMMLPFNLLQLLISFLVKVVIFFTGTNLALVPISQGILLQGNISQIGIMQTFYEILTLASLTIALKKNKFLQTIIPVIIYYVVLYSSAIFLFEKNIDATFITNFITYQSNYLIMFLLLFWFIMNKKSILHIFK